MDWPAAFLLTLCVEMPVLLFLLKGKNARTVLAAGFLMNLASHPTLWFVLPALLPEVYYIPAGEAIVLLMETAILKLSFRKEKVFFLLAVSFMVNSLSFLLGVAIDRFILSAPPP